MIGMTITPSHIDYSKILSDKTEHDLVMGDCIIILAQMKENTIRDTGDLVNSEMWAMSDDEKIKEFEEKTEDAKLQLAYSNGYRQCALDMTRAGV